MNHLGSTLTSRIVFLAVMLLLLSSCTTKDITVDLPDYPEQLVVEGVIEQAAPPYVILTHTENIFSSTDVNAISSRYVTGATVTVTTDGNVWTLDQLCSGQMDPVTITAISERTGLSPNLLSSANICIYSTNNPAYVGVIGKTYRLDVSVDGKSLSAVSSIPYPVPLDSVWFKLDPPSPFNNNYGRAWVRYTDPDTLGNCYRWMAKQTNSYQYDPDTDPYVAQVGSSYTDKYINGLTIDLEQPGANGQRIGDTVMVKWLSIGKKEYEFYSFLDYSVESFGSFSDPPNSVTNITGGLGIWAGRGVYLDTIICIP
ncbi:MAG: DUF4249 domain-containing protein [Flavobacteriales bacterium]